MSLINELPGVYPFFLQYVLEVPPDEVYTWLGVHTRTKAQQKQSIDLGRIVLRLCHVCHSMFCVCAQAVG